VADSTAASWPPKRPTALTWRSAPWLAQHPEGTLVYRDLAAAPPPHLTVAAITVGFADPVTHDEAQRAVWAIRNELVAELEAADVVLIGARCTTCRSLPPSRPGWTTRS